VMAHIIPSGRETPARRLPLRTGDALAGGVGAVLLHRPQDPVRQVAPELPAPARVVVDRDVLHPPRARGVDLPELRAAQDAGTPNYCPECGPQLTFGEGGG